MHGIASCQLQGGMPAWLSYPAQLGLRPSTNQPNLKNAACLQVEMMEAAVQKRFLRAVQISQADGAGATCRIHAACTGKGQGKGVG